ncbi:uncharacterized [Tachysurus ichikawai]
MMITSSVIELSESSSLQALRLSLKLVALNGDLPHGVRPHAIDRFRLVLAFGEPVRSLLYVRNRARRAARCSGKFIHAGAEKR